MSVWFVIPSKRPPEEARKCLEAWLDMGYNVAIAREYADESIGAPWLPRELSGLCLEVQAYQGWARSVNMLAAVVLAYDENADWIVTGGDDYFPDPKKRADDIAEECKMHFGGTFGVMQPTGDRWGEKNGEAIIDRIAGSPWMGREFCRRMYRGGGPLYPGYFHNFADEELQHVARKLDVFWQRRDLLQEHRHWARPRGDWRDAPEWAHKINHPQQSDWDYSKALFARRKAAGFPGHEPLER